MSHKLKTKTELIFSLKNDGGRRVVCLNMRIRIRALKMCYITSGDHCFEVSYITMVRAVGSIFEASVFIFPKLLFKKTSA